MDRKIILASSSPRRKEILEKMKLDFEIIPSDYEEILENFDFTYEKIENLAYKKAKTVADKVSSEALILGADTVVVLNKKILTKPQDDNEAFDMLKSLSGKKHFVVTSICIIDTLNSIKKISSTTSYVEFHILEEVLIKNYIQKYKPFDKAGAYGIQELPEGFIKNIEGSFENIIGLCPLAVNNLIQIFN